MLEEFVPKAFFFIIMLCVVLPCIIETIVQAFCGDIPDWLFDLDLFLLQLCVPLLVLVLAIAFGGYVSDSL